MQCQKLKDPVCQTKRPEMYPKDDGEPLRSFRERNDMIRATFRTVSLMAVWQMDGGR